MSIPSGIHRGILPKKSQLDIVFFGKKNHGRVAFRYLSGGCGGVQFDMDLQKGGGKVSGKTQKNGLKDSGTPPKANMDTQNSHI